MTPDALRALSDAAAGLQSDGLIVRNDEKHIAATARLITLAPDMTRLLADMADTLAYVDPETWRDRVGIARPDDLLARFRSLGEQE